MRSISAILNLPLPVAAICLALIGHHAHAQQSKVERLLQSQGVKTCLPEVRRISNFLSEGADYSSLVTSSKSAPDGAISLAHIVRNFDDGDVVATMSTAPTASGNCSSTYTVVTPFDKPCAVVRETTMRALTCWRRPKIDSLKSRVPIQN